jgi:hypothetical protein
MQTAAIRRYAVVTQPRVTASRPNEEPMAGNATFNEDTVYGTRNEASEDMSRMTGFTAGLYMRNRVSHQI